jgi:hypothetical protein
VELVEISGTKEGIPERIMRLKKTLTTKVSETYIEV